VDVAATFDASEAALSVVAPTLVLKHKDVQYITMGMATDLAARIPNAQLAILDGFWVDELEAVTRRMVEFLYPDQKDAPARLEPSLPAGSAIILFADIVDSTALTERLGDFAFRDRARRLDEAMRSAIRDANGSAVEGKLLGDGVLAVFTAARDAISAALACRDASRGIGLVSYLSTQN
jgi:class 3 adenylate cyclase